MQPLISLSVVVRILHPSLAVAVHEHLHCAELLHPLLLIGDVVVHEQVLADEDALLVNDVVELALLFLDDVLLVLLLVVVIVVLLIVKVLLRLLLLLGLIGRRTLIV